MLMVAAMASFAVNDALVKLATAEIDPAQIMGIRGAMAMLLLFSIAALRGRLRSPREAVRPFVLVRTLADVGATLLYITALANMPLSNASAIFQALPLTITLAAVLFLGERPGPRRWAAIAVGFVGVLVIIRPGTEGFTVYSLAVLGSVALSAIRDLATRQVPARTPTLFVAGVTATAVMLFGFAFTFLGSGWQPVSAGTVVLLALAAIAISLGYVAIVACMRIGEVGFVAPFRYTILLFAILFGTVVFGEVPGVYELIGAAIVVASGFYVIYREQRLGRVKVAQSQVH